jgi:hypothetical protein
MKKVEFKTFALDLKAADVETNGKVGMIRGYASTFGNVDLGGDMVVKGAFSKTLSENKNIPILADHNTSKQIGWNIRAEEDMKGLYVEGEIDLQNPDGLTKHNLARRAVDLGAKMGLSIGFQTIKAEPWKENPTVRQLKEIKLFEYSLVTFPMNTDAMIMAAKNFGDAMTVEEFTLAVREKAKQLGISMQQLIEGALRTEAAPDDGIDPAKSQSAVITEIERIARFLTN